MKTNASITIVALACICCLAGVGQAAEFCVGTAAELTDALSLAEANGDSDIVKVWQGTYEGSFGFVSHENADIAIRGGYGPACAERVIDPANTVIDAAGSPTPLSITKYHDGDVAVEGLTLKNGSYRGFYIRLVNQAGGNVGAIDVSHNVIANNRPKGGAYIASDLSTSFSAGPVRLTGNVITGNIGDYGGGGLSLQLPWGDLVNDVVLANNVVAGNIGSDISGGVFINPGSETSVYLINNTIADNRAVDPLSDVGGLYVGSFGNSALHMYNNIIQGNTSDSGVGDL